MKVSLVIPFMNQLHDAKGAMGLLRSVTSDETEWVIIDNGSTDPVEEFFRKTIRPKRLNYVRNEENVGMIKTMQQGYKESSGDVIAFLHNDVFIYEPNWDIKVKTFFELNEDLGMAGFFAAQGCGQIGERLQDVPYAGAMAGMSNMLEAEMHGFRNEIARYVAIFDGFSMIFNKKMLDKTGGFDQNYIYHHLYDRDASLMSLHAGYKNMYIPMKCHHWGGMTANRPDYQRWINDKLPNHKGYIRPGEKDPIGADMWTHDENTKIFKEKWADYLPLYVEDDGSLRKEGSFNGETYKTTI